MLLVAVGGLAFTLPPGPLCDEGMILFMEGGCDWGRSNEFFFSKLGLLITMNAVFVVAWARRVRDFRAFLPHFAVLALLTVLHSSDVDCRYYYAHPNGSIGQMTAEAMSFAALGVAVLARLEMAKRGTLLIALAAWNAVHVVVFHAALLLADHWTWLHTFLVMSALVGVAAGVLWSTMRDTAMLGAR